MKKTKQKTIRVREQTSTVVLKWIARVLMIIWTVLVLYPLIWAFFTSFKSTYQFMSDPWALPSKWITEITRTHGSAQNLRIIS